MAKQQVKFEVGQLVKFLGNRMGRVSKIAKNGGVYVIEIGETTEKELRVKKADLQLIEGSQTIPPVAPQGWDKIEAGHEVEKEVRDYLPQVLTGEQGIEESASEASEAPVSQDAPPVMEEPEQSTKPAEPVQYAFSLESAVALAEATYALRELTFSVTRHSILTAFIDVALNKDIPGYHHKVASNIKNLMEAAFDPVHDSVGYARINTWMWAALELVVKHKDRIAKMLNQPIEAAPIKMDRVTKLGMWIDSMMSREGTAVNDLTAAYDSCYMYNAIGKKVEACTFVVVEVMQAPDSDSVKILPVACSPVYYPEYVTAQSAVKMRQQFIRRYRPIEPDLHLYCGIVPILKTGRPMQKAVEDVLVSAIGSLK